MPTSFLSEDQRRRFGRFVEDPDEGQLAGSFLLGPQIRITLGWGGGMGLKVEESLR
ncbi:hypothetical protein ACIHCQ_35590 [Streptomyces sp. NPDC052236]|uniref:hypothetical protein n=1 Tax=Streptomyces sp. NPDC052236 TaxID=3365686 RepID=UPI0037CF0D15